MDIQIVVDAVFVILTAGAFWAWTKYIQPWLKEHHLTEAAQVAVRAVQALYGRYNGQEKFNQALDMLAEKGFDVDANEVIASVKAAWEKLDTEQIQAGIKTAE